MYFNNINLLSDEQLEALGFDADTVPLVRKMLPLKSVVNLLSINSISVAHIRVLLEQGIIAGLADQSLLPIVGIHNLLFPVPQLQDEGDEAEGSEDEETNIDTSSNEDIIINDCTTVQTLSIEGIGIRRHAGRGYDEERPGVEETAKRRAKRDRLNKIGNIIARCKCTNEGCLDIQITIQGLNEEANLIMSMKYKTHNGGHTTRGWQATAVATAKIQVKCGKLV